MTSCLRSRSNGASARCRRAGSSRHRARTGGRDPPPHGQPDDIERALGHKAIGGTVAATVVAVLVMESSEVVEARYLEADSRQIWTKARAKDAATRPAVLLQTSCGEVRGEVGTFALNDACSRGSRRHNWSWQRHTGWACAHLAVGALFFFRGVDSKDLAILSLPSPHP